MVAAKVKCLARITKMRAHRCFIYTAYRRKSQPTNRESTKRCCTAFCRNSPFQVARSTLCKSSTDRSVALTVTQAYVRLFSVPASENGLRSVPLAKFGNYEVRLAELPSLASAADLPIWVELYDHHIRCSIDGCGCSDLEDAIPAAEDLLSQAQRLNKGDEPCDLEGEKD
jgi:hypothetical protein